MASLQIQIIPLSLNSFQSRGRKPIYLRNNSPFPFLITPIFFHATSTLEVHRDLRSCTSTPTWRTTGLFLLNRTYICIIQIQSRILSLQILVINIRLSVFPHIEMWDYSVYFHSLRHEIFFLILSLRTFHVSFSICYFLFHNRSIFYDDQPHIQSEVLLIRSVCFRTNKAVSNILSYIVFLSGNLTEWTFQFTNLLFRNPNFISLNHF